MYARLVIGTTTPEKLDGLVKLWNEVAMPSAKQQAGFVSTRLLVNRKTGEVVSMGIWRSEADFNASLQWMMGQLKQFAALFDVQPVSHGYEIAGEADSPAVP